MTDPPRDILNIAADLIADQDFIGYEAWTAQYPAYDWQGSTDQRWSYKEWKHPAVHLEFVPTAEPMFAMKPATVVVAGAKKYKKVVSA